MSALRDEQTTQRPSWPGSSAEARPRLLAGQLWVPADMPHTAGKGVWAKLSTHIIK